MTLDPDTRHGDDRDYAVDARDARDARYAREQDTVVVHEQRADDPLLGRTEATTDGAPSVIDLDRPEERDPLRDGTHHDTFEAESFETAPVQEAGSASALPAGTAHLLDERWRELQLRFVDDPDAAVHDASGLVDEAIAQLTASLGSDDVGEASTEDKRQAFQRYRQVYELLTKA